MCHVPNNYSMSNYISCPKGHYYNDELKSCPFCTEVEPVPAAPSSDTTTTTGSQSAKQLEPQQTTPVPSFDSQNEDRTRIVRAPGAPASNNTEVRTLIGWLVTYDHVPSGQDYKIREGQNPVGRSQDCKIRITDDPELSSVHGMLLFREGQLWFRDEMASNATLVNDVQVGPGQTVPVNDGALIKLGSYTYLFRATGV